MSRTPIAIVGAACRLPGAPDPAAFWRRLAAGDDFVTEVPGDRWDVDAYFQEGAASPGKMFTRWGAFLDRVDLFDPRFFRITEREAVFMDPQQRLLLETAWDALADAGRPADSMAGSRTGVFVGISSYDYGTLIMEDLRLMSAFSGLGSALSVASNRISYCFDLHGPSLSVDTACSSSLVALHLACESLARGESETALVGGVNVVLRPNMMVGFSQAAMMAKDGRCKTFDARADGFVRAEGSVVLVLKPLEAATRDRDRIHAVIRGSATNQDGLTNGIAAPSGRAQASVIRAALESAGVMPREVSYVEAHGTGTSIGDAIEVGALRSVYLALRPEPESLMVGSTKTNLGHAEAASGLVGVLKLILSLAHERLPKHLHLETPNPHLGLHDGRLLIPTAELPWPRTGAPRRAGISAFGFGGTNAHAIIEEPPALTSTALSARSVHVVPLHARTETQLRAQAERLKERIGSDPAAIAELAHSVATAAPRFAHRAVCVARDAAELATGLDAIASGANAATAWTGSGKTAPRLAWIFSGQGAQRPGMGRALYETEPVYRAAFDRVAACIDARRGDPLVEVVFGRDSSAIDRTEWTQPALLATEWALAELWRSWGVVPDFVLGHSIGEFAAAAVAGVVTIEDAARLVEARARLMQSVARPGAMLSLRVGMSSAAELIAPWAAAVSIAAINTANDVVISGGTAEIEAITEASLARGIETNRLAVSHAFHSPLMDPILEAFESEASNVSFSVPRIPLVSNLTGALHAVAPRASYWRRHLREAVRFEPGVRMLSDSGVGLFLEIGPGSTGTALVRATAPPSATCVASLRRDRDETVSIAEAVARLDAAGASIDWRSRDRDRPAARVGIPGYAFDRKRFWLPDLGGRPPAPASHPLLGERVDLASPGAAADSTFRSFVSTEALPLLGEHRAFGRPLFPGAAWIEMALAAARSTGKSMSLADVVFERPLWLENARELQLSVRGDAVEIHGASVDAAPRSWTRHVTARFIPDDSWSLSSDGPAMTADGNPVDVAAAYEFFTKAGLEYGARFRTVRSAVAAEERCVAETALPDDAWPEAGSYLVHPGLLDGAFQVLALAAGELEGAVFLPSSIRRCWFGGAPPSGAVEVEARVDRRGAEEIEGSIVMRRRGGQDFARFDGFVARVVDRATLVAAGTGGDHGLHQLAWRPRALPTDVALETRPAARVLCDEESLADALVARGCVALLARDYEAALSALQASSEPTLIVTRGARLVGGETRHPALSRGAAIWGLGRVANTERRSVAVRLLDLDPARDDLGYEVDQILREVHSGTNEESVAIRSRRRLVERLAPFGRRSGLIEPPTGRPFRLGASKRGSFEGLEARRLHRRAPGMGEVEIRMLAAGLNFRDVMNALGTYPGDPGEIGIEGAGIVESVGAGVDHLRAGDRVAAMHPGLLGSFATIPASLAARLPDDLAFEDAAAIPVVYLTAHLALEVLGRVERGTRVLIHAAAGGVGLAAVQVAVRAGAEVFATAGTEEKRALLKSMGVAHVASSRTLDFATQFLEATRGAGVDLALNSLPGDFIERTLGLVSMGGRYVEIGKTGIWSAERVRAFRDDIRYDILALDDLVAKDPASIGRALQALLARFGRGELMPSPKLVMPLARARAAFRHMSWGRQVGKVVLSIPSFPGGPEARVRRDGSYVVTGGSGGVGIEMLRWLAREGAGHVILVSRGELDDSGKRAADEVRASGTRVSIARADVADRTALETALVNALRDAPPWRGLIHAAGTLADAPLAAQTAGHFDLVSRPKNLGFANLESIERTLGASLDFCLATSSLASLTGNGGQAPYAASNLWLAEQMQDRNARGLAGTAIHFGPWDAIGMTSRLPAGMLRQLAAAGISALSAEQARRGLVDVLAADRAEAGLFRMDVSRAEVLRDRSLFAEMARVVPSSAPVATMRLIDRLRELPAAERPTFVREFLARELAAVTGASQETLAAPDLHFADLGLDSLMAVDLRHRLQQAVEPHLELAANVLFTHPTIEAVSALVVEGVHRKEGPPPGPAPPPRRSDRVALRLLAIPYAGGGASAYARWFAVLPPWIDLEALQLPGREERSAEPPLRSVPEIARYLADRIAASHDGRPYALFGHSFGATLAVATAREIRRRNAPLPVHVALSGLGPSVDLLRRTVGPEPSDDLQLLMSRLESAGLALPVPHLDQRMRDSMLRALAADLDCAVKHAWEQEPVLELETSLWGGAEDRGATRDDLAAWSAFVRTPHAPSMLDGGHFYWRDDPRPLLSKLVEILAPHARDLLEPAGSVTAR